jgi:hypothetical protein
MKSGNKPCNASDTVPRMLQHASRFAESDGGNPPVGLGQDGVRPMSWAEVSKGMP